MSLEATALLKPEPTEPRVRIAYRTRRGRAYLGTVERVIENGWFRKRYRGKVQLIFTSPPFPLNRKKRYGNRTGDAYIDWLVALAPKFRELLTPTGSLVMEVGNGWEPGSPVMSTLSLEALLAFLKKGQFHLCQQFICHNPARLPSPAPWVTIQRIRVKDSYTHVWWMSPSERPDADNRRVPTAYSRAMLRLLTTKKYNAGTRPSQHHISPTSFLRDNGGAIPSNVLTLANTRASDAYAEYCRKQGLPLHPARMPAGLPEFFIKFLTKPRNLVLDPFAGSNTTGAVAEKLRRRWAAIEPNADYLEGSRARFVKPRMRKS